MVTFEKGKEVRTAVVVVAGGSIGADHHRCSAGRKVPRGEEAANAVAAVPGKNDAAPPAHISAEQVSRQVGERAAGVLAHPCEGNAESFNHHLVERAPLGKR